MRTMKACFILAAFCLAVLSSCATLYDRAAAKYRRTVNDTTYTNMTVSVPKDSAVLTLRTDTTHVIERVKQGRATVTIIREPTNTTVIANCDSASIQKKVATVIRTERWGVDPIFQERARTWKTVSLCLIGLLVLAIVVFILSRKYTIQPRAKPADIEQLVQQQILHQLIAANIIPDQTAK